MDRLLTKRDGLLRLSDGIHTMEVSPCVGDLAVTAAAPVATYLHRGQMISSGAGIVPADDVAATGTFGAYHVLGDDYDAEDLASLLRWWQGDDTTTTAIDGAGWVSTTERPDGRRTLHVEWFPAGVVEVGAGYLRIPDCVLTEWAMGEGEPNPCGLTVTSTTTARPSHLTV